MNSLSKNETIVGNGKRKCRRDNEVDYEDVDDSNGMTSRRRTHTSYNTDAAFSPSSTNKDDEEEEEEEEEDNNNDKNDPSFESPGNKKKQSPSTIGHTTKKRRSTIITSAKKRKKKEKQELKNTMKLLQETPTVICIRYCIDDPTQTHVSHGGESVMVPTTGSALI